MDYADKYLLNQFQDLTVHAVGQKKLLVTFGGKEDGEDGGSETIGMDNFKILAGCLSGKKDSGLTITDVVFPSFGTWIQPFLPLGRRCWRWCEGSSYLVVSEYEMNCQFKTYIAFLGIDGCCVLQIE